MPVIDLPDPCLVVLIGAAGSGKSTFAERHFAASDTLSSDAFRLLVSGDATNQGANRAAFGRLHRELARRLAKGRFTVVDATNVERAARRTLLDRAVAAGVPAVAIVLDLPTSTVLAQNAERTPRVVDEAVVRRHLERLRTALDGPDPPLAHEGFEQIVVLRDPRERSAVSFRRHPT